MTDDTQSVQAVQPVKKGIPTCLIIIIVLFILLLLSGVVMAVAGKFLISKFGGGVLKNLVENQTGVKIDTNKEGNVSFKDNKTGDQVNIGQAQIPADFPESFPIYPNAKPKGSVTGGTQNKSWTLILSTTDSLKQVNDYYVSSLVSKGWQTEQTLNMGEATTYIVNNNKYSGSLVVAWSSSDKETMISITLEPNTSTPQPSVNTFEAAPDVISPDNAEGNL